MMRWVAFVITLVGAGLGVISGTFQVSEHAVQVWLTLGFSALGVVSGALLLLRWRFAPWLLLAAAILGTIPDGILWEGAGSCFLVGALIGFSNHEPAKGA
ncbi:hypothetical protein [Alicyclobacillus sp. ALC3]|uniref:hypothetical protein n=1 Tax=Alicyclobacillus sp. ALC3 TaxID=2796143 RepID=UPI002379E550|nr:hypothetical protein [Alicyclobacillus sp. ALC3]WDL97497.1 hypothetical protein JC200_01845 [Alicyclobacillus sp. ALC3]